MLSNVELYKVKKAYTLEEQYCIVPLRYYYDNFRDA